MVISPSEAKKTFSVATQTLHFYDEHESMRMKSFRNPSCDSDWKES